MAVLANGVSASRTDRIKGAVMRYLWLEAVPLLFDNDTGTVVVDEFELGGPGEPMKVRVIDIGIVYQIRETRHSRGRTATSVMLIDEDQSPTLSRNHRIHVFEHRMTDRIDQPAN